MTDKESRRAIPRPRFLTLHLLLLQHVQYTSSYTYGVMVPRYDCIADGAIAQTPLQMFSANDGSAFMAKHACLEFR